MACQDSAEDCGAKHIAESLGLLPKKHGGWHGPCPVCKTSSFTLDPAPPRRWTWRCWRKPAPGGRTVCNDAAIVNAMLDLGISEECLGIRPGRRRRASHPAKVGAEAEKVLAGKMPPNAMRLALAMAKWDVGAREAADRLGMPRSTYYDAMRILGQRGPVRKLGQRRRSESSQSSPKTRTAPQVRRD